MLGNDVVDLQDADSRPESFRPRFDARVFSEAERRAIGRDARARALRWAHWGAKEAAYKLARQVDPHFVFRPSRLETSFEPVSRAAGRRLERRGRMALPPVAGVEGREVEICSFETPERVHVVAVPAGADWGAVDARVVELDEIGGDPSSAVRRLARREIARSLGVAETRLAIGRRGRIPVIELDGEETSLALSLSHHGRWIAFAMTPGVEADPSWLWARGPSPTRHRPGATTWQTT